MASLNKLLALSLLWTSAAFTACGNPQTKTNLNEAGPPMVRQVRLTEVTPTFPSGHRVFAFGSHPDEDPANQGRPVTTVSPVVNASNNIRIVFDELLVGNYLEQIQCRDTSFSDVPVGATPDDIAGCAEPTELLPQTCTGDFAVCLAPDGTPVGVADILPIPDNAPPGTKGGDGVADVFRFITSAVTLECGGIKVAIDEALSFWQPSGNQQIPSGNGFEVLGPAIKLFTKSGTLPVGKTCSIKFSDSVVDRDDLQACAPQDGDTAKGCSPGDTTQISFTVDAFKFNAATSDPKQGSTSLKNTSMIGLKFNTKLDPASLSGVKLLQAGTALPLAAKISASGQAIEFPPQALVAATAHSLVVPMTVTDLFGVPLPTAITINFTSAP
jgi:hypothetical protein